MSKETHNIDTSVAQPVATVTNPEQPTAPAKASEPVKPQTAQPTSTVKAPDIVKPQPTGNTVSTAPIPTKATEPVASQHTQPTEQVANPKQQTTVATSQELVKPQTVQLTAPVKTQESVTPVKSPEPVKPQTVQPTETVQEPVKPQITQPTEVTKLSDIIPTSNVWISGLIGNRQIDCLGPIEIPLKIDRPTYPFTPVPANSNYTNQVFNYDTGEWIATDAKSQGQMLTDLTKKVSNLQESSGKYDQTVGQSQKISLLFTQNLLQLTNKMDVIEHKLDNLLNSKDSDK